MAWDNKTWDDKREAELVRLWSEGLSASQIAARLGGDITRCAVLGKVHRMHLQGRAAERSRPPLKQRATRRPHGLKWGTPKIKPPEVVETYEPYIEPVTDETPLRSLVTLEAGECRWPIGDPKSPGFGFCGVRTIPGETYCQPHHKRAHAPMPAAKRQADDQVTVPAEGVRSRAGVSS